MTPSIESRFNHYYTQHWKHPALQCLQSKTIEAYSRAIRRIGEYFDGHLDDLSQDQLLDYFHNLLSRLSWSAVKLNLYGLKFFYTHVLHKPWIDVPMIRPPRCKRIPDIVTVEEAQQLFMSTRHLKLPGILLYALQFRFAFGWRIEPEGGGYWCDRYVDIGGWVR